MRITLALVLCAVLGAAGCGGSSSGASEPSASTLRVTKIEPTSAAPTGGVPLVVYGAGFMAESRAIQVYFGDAPASVLSVDSDTQMQIEVPAGEAGAAVDVRLVFEPGGEVMLPHAFTFAPG